MLLRRVGLAGLFLIVLMGILSLGIHTFTQNNSLGSDFYIFWQAGRAVFIDHLSPYSDEMAINNQLAIFKRLSLPGEDQLAFFYPPFALLPLTPFLFLPFDWAQSIWMAFLFLILVSSMILTYRRAPRWVSISFLLFYPVFFGLILGNFAVLLAALLFILLGWYLPTDSPDSTSQMAAGMLSAWLAVKPQFCWPFLLLLGLSALRKRQWPYIAALLVTFLILIGVSFWITPNWPAEWLPRLAQYPSANSARPVLTYLFQQILPLDLALQAAAGLGVLFGGLTLWLVVRWWQSRLEMLLLAAWLAFVGYLIHPHNASYEQILFLLPLAIWVCTQVKPYSFTVLAWWIASLVVSWVAFFYSSAGLLSATEWPILFHSLWIGWLLVLFSGRLDRKSA